jgi:acetyltransferase-like isoleucine patch superfamily enzyme
MPGVQIGEGAVIGAQSVVTKNIEPWSVVAGHPAKFIRKREMKECE